MDHPKLYNENGCTKIQKLLGLCDHHCELIGSTIFYLQMTRTIHSIIVGSIMSSTLGIPNVFYPDRIEGRRLIFEIITVFGMFDKTTLIIYTPMHLQRNQRYQFKVWGCREDALGIYEFLETHFDTSIATVEIDRFTKP